MNLATFLKNENGNGKTFNELGLITDPFDGLTSQDKSSLRASPPPSPPTPERG